MQENSITKTYLAILEGKLVNRESWDNLLQHNKQNRKTFVTTENDGSRAISSVIPLANNTHYTLVNIEIVTGRTHQIRAQASARGYPLAGDIKYGARPTPSGFFLHAWKLDFPCSITAPIPQEFLQQIESYFGKNIIEKL